MSIPPAPPYRSNPRPQLSLKNKAPKQKRWSHQDELESLRGKPIKITVNNVSGAFGLSVVLLEADQFTLKVRYEINGQQSVLTYNKSAIISYQAA